MGFWGWVAENWFNLLSVAGIVGGLCFTGFSLHSEAKTRRVANLLKLTASQRALMEVFYKNLSMTRILDPNADVNALPVNQGEEIYINTLIHHLASAFRAMQSDLTVQPEGLSQDVRTFFSLPLPKAVWKKAKRFQDRDFVRFVETCLRSEDSCHQRSSNMAL